MKKIFTYSIIIMLYILPATLYAQIIRGKVVDATTGKALGNVNVYFDGTFQGTVTDDEGNFSLSNVLKVNNPIVVSYVGYHSQKLENNKAENLNIRLNRKTVELKQVTISTDVFSRAKAMRIFLKEFIGATSSDCVINNPDDIYFRYNKKQDLLTAMADKPLLVTNKTLGYKITYFLTEFTHRPLKTQYTGNYFFEEDTAGLKPAAIKKILSARNDAYWGSRMHFVRSMWADDLRGNGFDIYKTLKGVIDYGKAYKLEAAYMLSYNRIVENIEGHKYVIIGKAVEPTDKKFENDQIYVWYNKKSPSFMLQKDGDEGVLINRNGYFGDGFEWKGDMGVARVNKLLPFEFMPAEK